MNYRVICKTLLGLVSSLFIGLWVPTVSHAEHCVGAATNVGQVGPTCVDKYEASVWAFPGPIPPILINRMRNGTATLAQITNAGGIQQGVPQPAGTNTFCVDPLSSYPNTFPVNGNWTQPLYAASIPNVPPSICISWFQAEQACALSRKRLLTNQEWQRAASNTPDGAPCNVGFWLGATGSFTGCTSNWQIEDMVGNAFEWVADWVPRASVCQSWTGVAGGVFDVDLACMNGAAGDHVPAAIIRGAARNGFGVSGENGVFSIDATVRPSEKLNSVGFRCAR